MKTVATCLILFVAILQLYGQQDSLVSLRKKHVIDTKLYKANEKFVERQNSHLRFLNTPPPKKYKEFDNKVLKLYDIPSELRKTLFPFTAYDSLFIGILHKEVSDNDIFKLFNKGRFKGAKDMTREELLRLVSFTLNKVKFNRQDYFDEHYYATKENYKQIVLLPPAIIDSISDILFNYTRIFVPSSTWGVAPYYKDRYEHPKFVLLFSKNGKLQNYIGLPRVSKDININSFETNELGDFEWTEYKNLMIYRLIKNWYVF